jgi:glutathione S-transferase
LVNRTRNGMPPLLYSYRRCPYAMRARMALLQAKRDVRVLDISLRDKPAAMLALSPKGTVPVLHLPDGQVLDESWDIMRWAFALGDHDGWWQRAQTAANLDLLKRNDGDFKRQLDRYKYPDRHGGDATSRDAARAKAVAALLVPLDARLQGAPFLGGATPCATDIAIVPFVRQFAAVEPAWFAAQNLAAVQAWLTAWMSSDLLAACMAKTASQSAERAPPVGGG